MTRVELIEKSSRRQDPGNQLRSFRVVLVRAARKRGAFMARRKSRRRSAAIASDLMLAPMVAFMRLPLMAAEAGNSAKAAETAMAVNEKAAAIAQGLFAAQMSLFGAAARFWPEVPRGGHPRC